MGLIRIILGGLAALLCCSLPALAAEGDYTAVSIERATGGLEDTGGDYQLTALGWHRGRDANVWLEEHLGFDPPGRWDYHMSYYLGGLDEPDFNAEIHIAAGLRIGWEIGDRLMPYLIGGTGPMLITQDLEEQATDINWGSYAGLGLEYRMDDCHALDLQVTTRHFSNASIQDPNSGVDTNSVMLKYLWYDE